MCDVVCENNFIVNVSLKILQGLLEKRSKRRSHPEVFCKNVFLKISQNSLENTCGRVSFLLQLQASGLKITVSISVHFILRKSSFKRDFKFYLVKVAFVYCKPYRFKRNWSIDICINFNTYVYGSISFESIWLALTS